MLIYVSCLAIYEHWATDSVNWQIFFWVVYYLFVAAVAWLEIRKGKAVLIFFGIALIMIFLAVNELTWINSQKSIYAGLDNPPVYTTSALAIALYLFYVFLKKVQWEK